MRKIAIIGAGSIVFCKTLVLDIMATPSLRDSEFALMAPTTRNTSQVEAFFNKVIEKEGLPAKVWITTDRREALKNADYVVLCFQVGGNTAYALDCEIPLKYGVDSCIGDSMGPGGVFRALRSIPVIRELCKEVRELCPKALILNYVNPMAMIGWALGQEGVDYVGLCHGVQTTLDLIAGYCGVNKKDVDFLCAGINHMGWFLQIEKDGVDLYPKFREVMEEPGHYINEKVRAEVLRNFGYFCTESTGHLSEYLPYFRKNQKALDLYCDEPGFGGETNAYFKFSTYVQNKYGGRLLDNEPIALPRRSVEYCSYILEAIETGVPFRFNGNVLNHGMIENLPVDCCAEGPLYADAMGVHRTIVGKLPDQLAMLNMTNINVQRLAVRAGYSGDPEHIVHALAMDPLTSAVLTLSEIRRMASEMLEAEREWLPQFAGKSIAPRPDIEIPKDVKRAPVPVDPALAIMARFDELGR
ncbi:MAG: alpha-galactosidase [Clostridiales bacterium]|jgi:alpha-galactosidase|nr:alpha-galactosidase [Clostridiales bacterium]OPZ68494.1 MAG: Alpha-galactosidase [Firmicutes bacterium ADurb.Bin467]